MKSELDLEKRLTQLRREVLARGYDRYPSLLYNISDLHAELQSPSLINMVGSTAIETSFAFPAQIHHGWKYIPKQALLFTPTDVIHILASIWPDQPPQITSISRSDFMCMRVSLLLLNGLLEIFAHRNDTPAQIAIEFNTVAWNRMSQPLEQFLQAPKCTPGIPSEYHTFSASIQQDIKKLPLKFSNGVYLYGQLPEDDVEELVFQPAIKKQWLIFDRRPLISNTLLILTTNFFIVIQEDPHVKLGWIITYIPRGNITRIYNQPCSLWNEITVELKRENQTKEFRFLLKNETTLEWRERWKGNNGQWIDIPVVVKQKTS